MIFPLELQILQPLHASNLGTGMQAQWHGQTLQRGKCARANELTSEHCWAVRNVNIRDFSEHPITKETLIISAETPDDDSVAAARKFLIENVITDSGTRTGVLTTTIIQEVLNTKQVWLMDWDESVHVLPSATTRQWPWDSSTSPSGKQPTRLSGIWLWQVEPAVHLMYLLQQFSDIEMVVVFSVFSDEIDICGDTKHKMPIAVVRRQAKGNCLLKEMPAMCIRDKIWNLSNQK